MFSQFKNIDSAFRHIRLFSFLLILANVLCICFALYTSCRVTERAESRRYILYNGKLLEAVASDKKSNLPVELRDHVKTFHQYFFSLSPDDKAIREKITRALYLADESAKKQYDNLRESGYYNNLISANIVQSIVVDSVSLDLDSHPYRFRCYATQKLARSSSTALRRLVTQGLLEDTGQQTDNNPHGFLIRGWEILENVDFREEGR